VIEIDVNVMVMDIVDVDIIGVDVDGVVGMGKESEIDIGAIDDEMMGLGDGV
ncbi:hypothetical protein KI387_022321, partial [Taxus chinensis]